MIVGNIARHVLGRTDNTVLFVTPETAEPFGPAPNRAVADDIIRRVAFILNQSASH